MCTILSRGAFRLKVYSLWQWLWESSSKIIQVAWLDKAFGSVATTLRRPVPLQGTCGDIRWYPWQKLHRPGQSCQHYHNSVDHCDASESLNNTQRVHCPKVDGASMTNIIFHNMKKASAHPNSSKVHTVLNLLEHFMINVGLFHDLLGRSWIMRDILLLIHQETWERLLWPVCAKSSRNGPFFRLQDFVKQCMQTS